MTVFIEIKAPAPFILSKQINSLSMIAEGLRDAGKITEPSFSTLQHLRRCCFSTVPEKDELCQAGITTYQNTEYVVMSRQHIWEVLSVCHSIRNHGEAHLEFLFGLFSGTVESECGVQIIYSFMLFIFCFSIYLPYLWTGWLFFSHRQQTINKLQKMAGNMFLLSKF